DLERIRRERLTNILQARDDLATIGSVGFSRVLYGNSHRYGTPSFGTAESIRSMTVDDLRAFHTSAFRPSNAALIVVGDVTPEQVMPVVTSSFGTWTAAPSSTAPALPPASQPKQREIFLIDRPGAAQSQIRIGWIGASRSTP